MRYVLTAVSLIIGYTSLRAGLSFPAHVMLLLPAAGMLWFLDVSRRPVRPCPHCDKGRDWDASHTNYGRRCRHCGARGEVLRPSAKLIKAFGGARLLRNLPEHMRSSDA